MKKLFRLDVRCVVKFRGGDARAARRWLYDRLRKHPTMFAAFDGPRDPIEMTFFASSGYQAEDAMNILFPKMPFEDFEFRVNYQCLSSDSLDHRGSFKLGRRKMGFFGTFTSKDTETGQRKL